MPTLSRLGASYASQPEQPLPHPHILIPLVIFFILGFFLNFAFNMEKDISKALVIGIAAPGLITNIIAGVSSPAKISFLDDSPNILVSYAAAAPPSAKWVFAVMDGKKSTNPWGMVELADIQTRYILLTWDSDTLAEYYYGNEPVLVSAKRGDDTVTTIQARLGRPLELIVPSNADSLWVQTQNTTTSIKIPRTGREASPLSILARVNVGSSGRGDLSWAFGGERGLRVRGISLTIQGDPRP